MQLLYLTFIHTLSLQMLLDKMLQKEHFVTIKITNRSNPYLAHIFSSYDTMLSVKYIVQWLFC